MIPVKHQITVNVNGKDHSVQVDSRTLLVDLLREELHLTGTHIGCIEGKCGACTVLVDDVAQKSCLILAPQVEGKKVVTVEGLERNGELDELQESFWNNHATQCGYCTSGMLMTGEWILKQNKSLDRDAIRIGISGNLCRCTGYVKIVEAIEEVLRTRHQKR